MAVPSGSWYGSSAAGVGWRSTLYGDGSAQYGAGTGGAFEPISNPWSSYRGLICWPLSLIGWATICAGLLLLSGEKYWIWPTRTTPMFARLLSASNWNRVPLISITSPGRIVFEGNKSLVQPAGKLAPVGP